MKPRHKLGGCEGEDRKSTRLNSSHLRISYAVFCLKKKKKDRNCCYMTPTAGAGSTACGCHDQYRACYRRTRALGSLDCGHRLTIMLSFFFNDTATTEIYTLSLHDALPIYRPGAAGGSQEVGRFGVRPGGPKRPTDRKSTRLNSSHLYISYAVFCLKKK